MCILEESFISVQEEKDEISTTDDHMRIFSDENSVRVCVYDEYA